MSFSPSSSSLVGGGEETGGNVTRETCRDKRSRRGNFGDKPTQEGGSGRRKVKGGGAEGVRADRRRAGREGGGRRR